MGTKATRQSGGKGHVAKGRGKVPLADHVEGKMAPASKAGRKPKVGTAAPGGTDLTYLALIRRFPLRPIRSDAELDAASEVVDEEKEKANRLDQQFRESLDWYRVSVARKPGAALKPQPVLRWLNPTRGQKGEPTLILWTDSGRPEALASVYSWNKNLIYETVSLARGTGLTASEGGRTVWSPAVPGVDFREVPEAPAPADSPGARLVQMKSLAERFKVTLKGERADTPDREEMRLLPKPIYRYELSGAKADHPGLIDGAIFAFVQGTDPEAVLLVEAVRRGDRAGWQYAFGRATAWSVEGRLGSSVVWTASGFSDWNNPRLPMIALGRPLAK